MQDMKLQCDITDDCLAEVEPQLVAIILQRLIEKDRVLRNGFVEQKILPVLFVFVKVMSALLLILMLLMMLVGTGICNSLTKNVFLSLFVGAMLFVFWDRQRLDKKLKTFRDGLLVWAANKRGRLMLKHARKLAPFTAEYDFRGDLVTYYRVKNNKANFVWYRKIAGCCLVRPQFAVLFKDTKSPQPFAIILHSSAADLAAYLETQSCPQVAY